MSFGGHCGTTGEGILVFKLEDLLFGCCCQFPVSGVANSDASLTVDFHCSERVTPMTLR